MTKKERQIKTIQIEAEKVRLALDQTAIATPPGISPRLWQAQREVMLAQLADLEKQIAELR